MRREIVINACAMEVRVALLEGSALTEFYLERKRQKGLAGNIYKGKVTRVLPGMQAAFVHIGLERAGFLHVSDFREDLEALGSVARAIGEADVETETYFGGGPGIQVTESPAEGTPTARAAPAGEKARARRRSRGRGHLPIEQQLRRGQEIIVQIAKEPMGTKGARLTSSISLPGRYLVYLPTSNHVGISRRIESAEERARLRGIVSEMRPAQGGFIVRTACEGVSRREIQRDISFLTKLWASLLRNAETSPPAAVLYSEPDLVLRTMRDLFSREVDRLWCDEPDTYQRVTRFVRQYMPRLRSRLTLYEGEAPIFDHFGIEPQIEQALERRVPLKSGGYLVFDQAEALTAIDVNTGRFVGKRTQQETVLKTNLEAADEVVKQLRLRNIGGIIVVDFIDMEREADRKRVNEALAEALKRDKARTAALEMSELGLAQMTRKRTRESLEELLTDPCPRCQGRRVVKSVPTLAAEMLRAISREAQRRSGWGSDTLLVGLNPEVARFLYDVGAKDIESLERRLDIKVVLRSKEELETGAFEFSQAPAAA